MPSEIYVPNEADVQMVMSQTGADEARATALLADSMGDVVTSIMAFFGKHDPKPNESPGEVSEVQSKINEMRHILDEKDFVFQEFQEQQQIRQQQQQQIRQQQDTTTEPTTDTATDTTSETTTDTATADTATDSATASDKTGNIHAMGSGN